MEQLKLASWSDAAGRGQHAEAILSGLFANAGWKVGRHAYRPGSPRVDLVVRRGKVSFAVEVKAAPEGRSDRLVPLWSQACLQAARAAVAGHHRPLAVVAAPRIPPHVAEQVLNFASEFVPDVAAGVIDFGGLRRFRGRHLEGLDSSDADLPSMPPEIQSGSADLFSDLNQWMLKVLLAPEVPEKLLAAPRGLYRNASQLAKAAHVSVMSAFRLVQQLQREGYLHESAPDLSLVRRKDLFRRWQAAEVRRVKEVPMRFLLRGDLHVELKRILAGEGACLALFAAADALGLGFVRGVPPHVYVRRLSSASLADWKNLVPARQGEPPDLIVRQAPAPQSVFRGLVRASGLPVCDVLQVWLDVASHPSRGQEQADLIGQRVLQRVISGEGAGG